MAEIKLRDYQKEAIRCFEQNNNKGILEMATGTGKTITALKAIQRNFEKNNRQFLVIIVPFLHLIDQWVKDFNLINLKNYTTVAYGKNKWYSALKSQIWEYNRGFRDRVVVVGSYKSMGSEDFQHLIAKVYDNRLLVADECHYLGSPTHRNNKFTEFESSLGLSATPRRWWDELGTQQIYSVFKKTVYEYTMEEAIENNYLTSYYYYPKLTKLTEEEEESYEYYSTKIGQLISKKPLNSVEKERLETLLRKRSTVLQKAENKVPQLIELLKKQKDKKYTLVYCAPGEVDNIIQEISALDIKVHRFNSEINIKKRGEILKLFGNGEIEVLVAIKCLDEGVDVPATRTAYFLSSTSNPREFVQRRGRVLRLHEGKQKSIIYDFITLQDDLEYNTFNSIAKREMPRYAEFANVASNKYQEREELWNLLTQYNLEMYLNITPWEMYEILKKDNGGHNETTRGYY